jgi:hypothetical protein
MSNRDARKVASTAISRVSRSEVLVAVGAFVAMCVVVLLKTPQLLEPDDYAYRASIVALSEGHVVLTNAQFLALQMKLSLHGGGGILQWTHLANGKWISQKNPGYPFFAVVFQLLHVLRWAPLFYGALACGGLFYGARRWLGSWGGTYAVVLYCSSGAALNFAWRATMPTFSDASLVAAAAGVLLGVLLSKEDPGARRLVLGVLAFLALDGAVLIRYSDVGALIVALIAVVALYRVCSLSRAMIFGWFAVVVLFALGDFELNRLLYGGFFTTGYPSGLITFAASAIAPNVERLPSRLIESMPMLVLAVASIAWIGIRFARTSALDSRVAARVRARVDATVALVLTFGWLSVWGLYAAYTWTVGQTIGPGNPVHVVRFYLPALGLIALLAAWLLKQLPRWGSPSLLALLAAFGVWSFQAPSNHEIFRPGPPPAHQTGAVPGSNVVPISRE